MATSATPGLGWRNDRLFYTGMGLVVFAAVFIGFAQSYYLTYWLDPPAGFPALSALLHVHGFVFSCWIALQAIQPALVAKGNRSLHRTLGYSAVVLAPLMVVLGIIAGIDAVKRGSPPIMPDPRMFFTVPFFGMLTFAAVVGLGIYWRRRAETHKRLMLLSSATILDAAVARYPGVLDAHPVAFFAGADVIILLGILYDLVSRGRVHKVWIYGGGAVILSQALRLAVAPTEAWLPFTDVMVGLW